MKLIKVLVFLLCLFVAGTSVHASGDCDQFSIQGVTRTNCERLQKIEADQKRILKNQEQIKKALEILLHCCGPRLKAPWQEEK